MPLAASAATASSLYVRHRSGLAAHARRFLRDQRDVDEVVQETFLRLFLAIDEIETELQAIAFARRTLTNLCIDRYRADRRRPSLVDLDSAPVCDLSEDWNDDDPVLRAEDAAVVREALARLTPLHRAALVKREIEEKPLSQIAVELDVPEESVKHLLFRARRALRRLLVGTSVEPGVDLTAADVAAIANRRAATAMLRGANVFIVLVVGAIVAAVGVRTLEGRSANPTAPSEAFGGSLPASSGVVGPTATHPLGRGPAHHGGKTDQHPLRAVTKSTPVLPVVPVQDPPTSGTIKPGRDGFGAARGHFRLSGPLRVTGTPKVAPTGAVSSDGGTATTATSRFVADTSEGTFQLDQSVSTSPLGEDTVSVTPSFVVGNAVQTPTMTGSSASVSTAADGTVAVDVVANAAPDPTSNAFPLTSMSVRIVLSPDLSQVRSETVVLSSEPQATAPPTTQPAAPPVVAPTAPTTTVPPPTEPPPATPGGSDTDSGSPPGGQALAPGVLEISDMSNDDRQGAGSF